MVRSYILALLIPLCGFSLTPKKPICENGLSPYRISIRHIEKGGIGYEDGYTTLETFFASDPNKWAVTPFFDARGHIFDNGKWAVNAGAGIRRIWKNRVYGFNTYYDYRNTSRFHANQMGAGIESLGTVLDFRMNGYLPIGAKTSDPYDFSFQTFSGHSMLISQKIQSAMKGADAEFGFHFGKGEIFDFYAAAGPYYFIGRSVASTWGGKGRISATYKNIFTAEISDSYDRTFHNKFQGQISFNFRFGPRTQVKEGGRTCKIARTLNERMFQTIARQEIIVIDTPTVTTKAINPATGLPYYFVFVNNTSSSSGTIESPYPSLAQAQENSSPSDILYIFPGDGTTTGMNSGITLKDNQQLWGSGIAHSIQTTVGTLSIPSQTLTSPILTNLNIDTDGNGVTLANNNSISGLTFAACYNDAIYGANIETLTVSDCLFQTTTTYPIEASFPNSGSISITNNQFSNNVNGILLNLNGTSTLVCSNNTFAGQTSVSSTPIEIIANNNTFSAQIENNLFQQNTTGSLRVALNTTSQTNLIVQNNTFSTNATGSQSTLASNVTLITTGTAENCSIQMNGNRFSDNTSNSLYLHTSGAITNLAITVDSNTMSNNGGSAVVIATPSTDLNFSMANNTISDGNDNAIAVITGTGSTSGNITIDHNTISGIGNSSNGMAFNQDFTNLSLTITNNQISDCEGTGIISYAPTGIASLSLDISNNTISGCQNLSSNAASGIDIEQFTDLQGSITNNTLSTNSGTSFMIGSSLTAPSACLNLTGNNNTDYLLVNPGDGIFNLSPCNADTANTGTINTSGTIDLVQSCPNAVPCP